MSNPFDILVYLDENLVKNLSSLVLTGYIETITLTQAFDKTLQAGMKEGDRLENSSQGSISKSDINIMIELINHRYFNKLPVIVSTELSIENLVNIDEALGSRLIEMSKDFLVGIRNKKLNYRIYG